MEFCLKVDDLVLSVPDPNGVGNSSIASSSAFDQELMSRWNEAVEAGVCRYRLNLQTKKVPGKYGLIAQLNPERATKRRLPQDMQQVNPAFDPEQFHFNKVSPREILMKLKSDACQGSDNVVIINVSPFELGSCLLVPNVSQNIRQIITLEGFDLLINLMLCSNDPNLKSGFNSPGGYASVNHQHYHLYYFRERLQLEILDVQHIAGPCYALTEFPSKGFAFQLEKDPAQLAKDVFTLVSYLRENDIAHNVFATRGKRFAESVPGSFDTLRVYVWAREPAFGIKKETGFLPAMCELSGQLLIKEAAAYDEVSEESIASILEEATSSWFQRVLPQITKLYP